MTQEDRPAEAQLFDDPTTADLGAKVSEAWRDFSRALAAALPALPKGTRLDITLDPLATGIDDAIFGVSATAAGPTLEAYAVGNTSLPPEHRLPRTAIGELVALGWSPPGVVDAEDERFGLHLPMSEAGRLAAIVSRTLRDVYGTPHPAFLIYTAHPAGDEPVDLPQLGAARHVPPTGNALALRGDVDLSDLPLAEQVHTVISAMLKTTPDALPVDGDGDINIRSGSAMVFVRVRDNPPLVDVFSPVLTEVETSEQLYARLSELTHRMPIGRLYCTGDTVWASVPVFGRDFQATHLMLAVQVMTGLADELDDRLHGEFGGKRFFVEGDRPAVEPTERSSDGGTGMYL